MSEVRQLIDLWGAKVLANPDKVKDLDVTYKLVVEGQDGGSWRLSCSDPVTLQEGDGVADCTVHVDTKDFIALLEKRLNPQAAYITGKLRVSGNIALALKLAYLF